MTWKSFFSRRAEIRKISMGKKTFQRRSKNTNLLKLVPLQWWNKKQKNIVVSNLKWKKSFLYRSWKMSQILQMYGLKKMWKGNLMLQGMITMKISPYFFVFTSTHQKMPSLRHWVNLFLLLSLQNDYKQFLLTQPWNRKSGDLLLMIKEKKNLLTCMTQ